MTLDEQATEQGDKFILVENAGSKEMDAFDEFDVGRVTARASRFLGKEIFSLEVRFDAVEEG